MSQQKKGFQQLSKGNMRGGGAFIYLNIWEDSLFLNVYSTYSMNRTALLNPAPGARNIIFNSCTDGLWRENCFSWWQVWKAIFLPKVGVGWWGARHLLPDSSSGIWTHILKGHSWLKGLRILIFMVIRVISLVVFAIWFRDITKEAELEVYSFRIKHDSESISKSRYWVVSFFDTFYK